MKIYNRKVFLFPKLIFFSLLLSIFLIDRYFWAGFSQWREDQATNLWLGYVHPIQNSPVGLISSIGTPNPNGMLLFTKLMSIVPSLTSLGVILSIIQLFIILYFLKSLTLIKTDKKVAAAVLMSSVVIRSAGSEIWQTIAIMNMAMIYFALWTSFLKRPSPTLLVLQAFCLILFPAIYLSGLCNSIVGGIMTAFAFVIKKPRWTKKNWLFLMFTILLFGILMFLITWLPFLKNLDLTKVSSPDHNANILQRLKRVGGVLIFFPEWICLFSKNGFSPISQYDLRIFSSLSRTLSSVHGWIMFTLSVLTLFGLGKQLIHFLKTRVTLLNPGLYILFYLILMLSINVMLGNWRWHRGERLDQSIQFYPFFLALFCFLPEIYRVNFKDKRISYLPAIVLLSFVCINSVAGISILTDLAQYKGPIIPTSDVSWFDREHTVEEIVRDAKTKSTAIQSVSVEYLMVEPWAWEASVDHQLAKFYPPTYRAGRAMDYELLRRYHVRNELDGIFKENIPHGTAQYVVAYDNESTLDIENRYKFKKFFGRIKLLIRD